MACMWIGLGSEEEGWVTLFLKEQREALDNDQLTAWDYYVDIYANSFYFML